ncbi:MAG TPA: hypothetical protein VGN17_26595 [Bryobacteraceae bacterium]|jgi:hypothetical protein
MKTFRRVLPLLLLTAAAMYGQTKMAALPNECQSILKVLLNSDAARRDVRIASVLKLELGSTCFARLFVQRNSVEAAMLPQFVKALESLRTDIQAGASTGGGGGTNLVSKGTTAKVLSVAAEYGAITESVNKQVVTIQGSLDGLPLALARKDFILYCSPTSNSKKGCLDQGTLDVLRRFSYGVSFDTSSDNQTVTGSASGAPQGTTQPVTFTANRKQITGWEGRVVLWNARDAVSKTFQANWAQVFSAKTAKGPASSPDLTPLTDAANALYAPLEVLIDATPPPGYDDWYKGAFQALQKFNGDQDGLATLWMTQIDAYLKLVETSNPEVAQSAASFLRAMARYELEQRAIIESVANKPVLTLQYNNDRPTGQASTSTARLIFDKGLGSGVSVAANGAVTLYNSSLPSNIPGVSRLRDAQFGFQVQKDLGTLKLLGAAAVSGTYYFQYQNSPAILNVTPGTPLPGITFTGLPSMATQVFADKGNLHVGQLRLILGPGSSSVRFPLAVSFSNRTELIDKPTWKAQVGVSYDFDSLFAK